MNAFDWTAAEEEFGYTSTLRFRAAAEWDEQSELLKAELVTAAGEVVYETLGEMVADDVCATILDMGGDVEMRVDGLRFKVEIRDRAGIVERKLCMSVAYRWPVVRSLADVGRLLAEHRSEFGDPLDGRGLE